MMDTMPLATLLARRATEQLAHSAEPGAPVVADRAERAARRRTGTASRGGGPRGTAGLTRTRTTLAAVLHRAADAVAPACVPGDGPHAAAR